jgi:microcystin-dependent protein
MNQDNQSSYGIEQELRSIAEAILGGRRDPTVLSPDVGDFKWRAMETATDGYLLCDGSAVSRTTYSDLFDYLCPIIGTFTVTIATPAVFTLSGHGLTTGQSVYLTTTGALPTGLTANTLYYVIRIDANTFNLATSRANAIAGTKIATSGTQSGVHTLTRCGYGLGNGSTTFNVPNVKGKVLVGVDTTDNDFIAEGATGGAKTHTLTIPEMPAHTHTMNFDPTVGGIAAGGVIGRNTSVNTGSTGGGGAHNNLQPFIGAHCFIKY